MTTWTPGTTIPRAIHSYIESQKARIKERYTSRSDLMFIREWLAMSYEGYRVHADDIGWVRELLHTTQTDITVGFLRNEYVFKVDNEEFALKPMVVNERKDVFEAYRHEIQEQIKEFRQRAFHNKKVHTCPETGIALKNDMDTHTDHHFRKKAFIHLVEEFNVEHNIDFNRIEIQNCGMFYRLKDRSLAEKWKLYHQEHAILRLIHSSANTNAEFYLKKYSHAPYERTLPEKKPKLEPIPSPKMMTFDQILKNT